jgi:hypothetical protein
MSEECKLCNKDLTTTEFEECSGYCYECRLNNIIKLVAVELREARITFEELFRKILAEVDK